MSQETETIRSQYEGRIVKAKREIATLSERLILMQKEKQERDAIGKPLSPIKLQDIRNVERSIQHKQTVLANLERRYGGRMELAEKHEAGIYGTGVSAEYKKPKPEYVKGEPLYEVITPRGTRIVTPSKEYAQRKAEEFGVKKTKQEPRAVSGGGIPVSEKFYGLYKKREPEIKKIREMEAVTEKQPYYEAAFYPYGKFTSTVRELGKFGEVAYQPYGEGTAIFPKPIITTPKVTYKSVIQEELAPKTLGKELAIYAGIGAGTAGLIEVGKRAGKKAARVLPVVGAGVTTAWITPKVVKWLTLAGPTKGPERLRIGLETTKELIGFGAGAGAVSRVAPFAVAKVKEFKYSRSVSGETPIKAGERIVSSKEVSPLLRVKDVKGFTAVRESKIEKEIIKSSMGLKQDFKVGRFRFVTEPYTPKEIKVKFKVAQDTRPDIFAKIKLLGDTRAPIKLKVKTIPDQRPPITARIKLFEDTRSPFVFRVKKKLDTRPDYTFRIRSMQDTRTPFTIRTKIFQDTRTPFTARLKLAQDTRPDVAFRFKIFGDTRKDIKIPTPFVLRQQYRNILTETTKYVPEYSKPYLIDPREAILPEAFAISTTGTRTGFIKPPKRSVLTGKEVSLPFQPYEFKTSREFLVSPKAMQRLSQPYIDKKILDVGRDVTLKERAVATGKYEGVDLGYTYDWFSTKPRGRARPKLEQWYMKLGTAYKPPQRVGYQYKLGGPEFILKPMITESGVALGTRKIFWRTGKEDFITAGVGKQRRALTKPFEWIREPKPSGAVTFGAGGAATVQLLRPKVVTGVKFRTRTKQKTEQVFKPLTVSMYKTRTKTAVKQKQYHKTFEEQLSTAMQKSKLDLKSIQRSIQSPFSAIASVSMSKTAQRQLQSQMSGQMQVQTQAQTQLQQQQQTQIQLLDVLQVQELAQVQKLRYRKAPYRTPPEYIFSKPPTPPIVPFDLDFKFKSPFVTTSSKKKRLRKSYTPTLIGMDFLKPIKYSKKLVKMDFPGTFSIRPMVKL